MRSTFVRVVSELVVCMFENKERRAAFLTMRNMYLLCGLW